MSQAQPLVGTATADEPPRPRTHMLHWIPEVLCKVQWGPGWDLISLDEWDSDIDGTRIVGGLDTPAEELRRSVAADLGLDVVEFRPATWRIDLRLWGDRWVSGPWANPAFDVVAEPLAPTSITEVRP